MQEPGHGHFGLDQQQQTIAGVASDGQGWGYGGVDESCVYQSMQPATQPGPDRVGPLPATESFDVGRQDPTVSWLFPHREPEHFEAEHFGHNMMSQRRSEAGWSDMQDGGLPCCKS